MEVQRYVIDSCLLFQANNLAIFLAKNGRMSAGENSKHIKNRFFIITDKVAQGDLSIGTNNIWADVNTKPVQGLLFCKFCHATMGIPVKYDNDTKRRSMYANWI